MAGTIIEIEQTGPVVRVWVAGVDEDDVADFARGALGGTDALPDVVYHSEGAVFEAIFEAGDLQ